ncbi:MAG: LamG domain-containing protein [Treponema sp.]|jgi:hypothetical protein|nr:LamG domain-containing protein [Treponema sp.]
MPACTTFHIFGGRIGLGNAAPPNDEGSGSTGAVFGVINPANYNGKWTHLALTMESGRAALYINGVKFGNELTGTVSLYDWVNWPATEAAIEPPQIDSLWIGGTAAHTKYLGLMSDVRLYNGVLSPGEIAALAGGLVDSGITYNDYPTAMLWGAASTSRPNASVFTQGSGGNNVNIVLGNLSSYAGSSVWIDYKITDIFNKTVKAGSIEYLKSGGNQQQKSFAIDTAKLGHYTVTVTVDGRNLLGDRAGSRPAGFITYAVVVDPGKRRPKAPYGPGVDKYIYFGMAFFPASPDPGYYDGLNLVDYMGVDASITGDMSWRSVISGSGTGTDTRTNTALLESNNGAMITKPIYEMIEMTPYFPDAFRTVPGGLYGGQLNALGEQELTAYVKSLAKVHIDKAGWRPHHYYQVLWEPVDWWFAWIPGGETGDTALVRFYEVAYKAIHEVYDAQAVIDGGNWRPVPVVLGPTYSDGTNIGWHQRIFNRGLANYIDGLSIHPYDPDENGLAGGTGSTGNGNDLAIANGARDIMALVRSSYAGRWNPKYHAEPFFWGTEQGMMDDTGGPILQAQVLTRYNLIMMGEGFDANHMFKFSDNDENEERYGFFYNQTAMADDWQRFAPATVSPKQSAAAFAATSWLLKGYKGAGRITGLPGTNFGYRYTDTESSGVIYAVWNYAGAASSVTINTGGNYKVYDIVGNETSSGSGSVTLATNGYVQYVKVN